MTNILGTIKDSKGTTLSGTLRTTLARSFVDDTTNPDSVLLPISGEFTITAGVVDINLLESQTFQIPYRFQFFEDSDPDTPVIDFYAVVPNVGTVQFGSLLPTGISNANLDTGAFTVARYLANDPNLASLIRPDYTTTISFNSITSQEKRLINKPFSSGISVKNLRLVLTTGFTDWVFELGYVDSVGVDQNASLLTTVQDAVIGGRRWVNLQYDIALPANTNGLWIQATPGVGSGSLNGTATINYIEF